MLKNVLRLLATLTALFAAVLSVMLVTYDNAAFPLGTSRSFSQAVTGSDKPKDVLVGELNDLAHQHGIAIYQRAINEESTQNAQDLIAFGLGADNVSAEAPWFDPATGGEVVPWTELGDRPFSGYFMMTGGEAEQEAVAAWAESNGIDLQWEESRHLRSFIGSFTLNNGIGMVALSVLVTLLACVIVWYVSRARSGALRLLAGVPLRRIIGQDLRSIYGLVLVPLWLTWVVSLALVAWRYSTSRVPLYAAWSAGVLGVMTLVLAVVILAIALLGRPDTDSLARRTPPLSSFVHMGWVIRAAGVLVAVVVIPYSAQYVTWAQEAQSTVTAWTNARNAVTVTMTTLIDAESGRDEYEQQLASFIDDAAANDLAATSVLQDSSYLPEGALEPYDGIAVVDGNFLTLVGVESPVTNTDFTPVDREALPPGIRDEYFDPRNGTLTGFTRQGHEGDLRLYQYHGEKGVPVISGTLSDAQSTDLRGKLVVYVDDAMETFKPGLLESTIVNGQTVFRDAAEVRALIHKYSLEPYTSSVDNAADRMIIAAREYRNQARFGVCAGVLGVAAILIAMIEAAQVWAATNRRRIFVMHSAGTSIPRIARWPVIREAIFMALAGVAAMVFSAAVLHIGGFGMVLLVCGIVLAATLAAAVAYTLAARGQFRRAIGRKD